MIRVHANQNGISMQNNILNQIHLYTPYCTLSQIHHNEVHVTVIMQFNEKRSFVCPSNPSSIKLKKHYFIRQDTAYFSFK